MMEIRYTISGYYKERKSNLSANKYAESTLWLVKEVLFTISKDEFKLQISTENFMLSIFLHKTTYTHEFPKQYIIEKEGILCIKEHHSIM